MWNTVYTNWSVDWYSYWSYCYFASYTHKKICSTLPNAKLLWSWKWCLVWFIAAWRTLPALAEHVHSMHHMRSWKWHLSNVKRKTTIHCNKSHYVSSSEERFTFAMLMHCARLRWVWCQSPVLEPRTCSLCHVRSHDLTIHGMATCSTVINGLWLCRTCCIVDSHFRKQKGFR